MGKVEIGIYFCATANISIHLKRYLSSPRPSIRFLSKSLNFSDCHSNQNAIFEKNLSFECIRGMKLNLCIHVNDIIPYIIMSFIYCRCTCALLL